MVTKFSEASGCICDCFRLAYFTDFPRATNCAAAPADQEVASTYSLYETANMPATVTSQFNGLPAFVIIIIVIISIVVVVVVDLYSVLSSQLQKTTI